MKVLLVDDEPEFLEFLRLGLEHQGVDSVVAQTAEQALEAMSRIPRGDLDAILLDVRLPDRSGWDVLADLRRAGNEVPVLFVTGVDEVSKKVQGLGMGADDYLVKPFSIEELVARIRAVLRRRQLVAPLEFGEVKMDLARRRVWRGNHPIELTPKEFEVLLVLVRAKGKPVARDELIREVWGRSPSEGTNLLDVHIGRLRRKLERRGRPLILNVRGKGYSIVPRADGLEAVER